MQRMIKITHKKKVYISPETQQSMYEFFLKTSAPRLAMMKEIEKNGGKSVEEQIKEFKKKNK